MTMKSALVLLSMLAAVALSSGCAQLQLGPPVASIDNIQKTRSFAMAPVMVGVFVSEKSLEGGVASSISIRSNSVSSPVGNSFAAYLRETLVAELKAAGLYDDASKLSIQGELTQTVLEAPIGTGKGMLAARFRVFQSGTAIYDRELIERSQWDSPFLGAIAIPAAMGEYSSLHRKLVGQLLDDPDFRRAVTK